MSMHATPRAGQHRLGVEIVAADGAHAHAEEGAE